MARIRQVETAARCGGVVCPLLMQTRVCMPRHCPGARAIAADGENLGGNMVGTRLSVFIIFFRGMMWK